ncbi:MAG: hypothetical protein AAFN76_13955 [Pseudomonadota bacterium]
MKIDLTHVFGAAATVGLAHYGITSFEDAAVSLDWGAKALYGAIALEAIAGLQEVLADRKARSNEHDNDDASGPDNPAP